jgi:uracil-DNA glycosylase family 4
MGFLFAETASGGDFKTKAEAEWLEQLGCKACPLNTTPGKIDATGSTKPLIYILGEAAGADEEVERRQFIGKAGKLLRELLPRGAEKIARWNNSINCHPPRNRNPSAQELACCKPRVSSDIEKYKPKAIWGFGNVPLHWVSGFHGINNWRGRRMPVKIGSHTCWYYPFFHPSFLGRIARDNRNDFGSEDERMTWFDLQRAYDDLDGLEEPIVHTTAMAKANIECITDIGQIRHALQWAARQPHVGLDYETNRKRPYAEGAKILSASVGTLEKAYAFPMHHPGAGYSKKQIAEIEELWRRFLTSAGCVKRVHSLAFELEWSGVKFGIETIRARPWEDTSNLAAIINERTGGKKIKSGPFSLEFLVQERFGFNVKKISNVDRKNLESTPLDVVLLYNGIDAKYHDALGDELWKDIRHEKLELPSKLAQRRVPTVVLSQIKGAPVDQEIVNQLHDKYKEKVERCEYAIQALDVVRKYERRRGKVFNPFSGPDLKIVFDEMLKCPEVWVEDKYSKERKFTTEETALDEIIKEYSEDDDAHVLAKALIELRQANGTKSKYIDALKVGSENCVVYPDGLIHVNYNTYFAETGRLSCDEPNIQNFPKREEETREVRRSIAAKKSELVLAFDYGQIEARVIAMFTKDKTFVKALWERWDVHQNWAERLAYEYPERIGGRRMLEAYKAKTKEGLKVMKDFRTDIKNQWTFPLFFGAQARSVAGYLKMPQDIIEEQIEEFWKMFPEAKNWQDGLVRFYKKHGYVECLTGRRRHGPMTLNQVINSPVQGTAAEIVLDAMSRLSEKNDPEIQPEVNIHDDLTFLRVPVKRAEIIAEKVVGEMLRVPFKWAHIVPITVEMSMGDNWCDLEELKDEKGQTVSVYSSDQWNF